MTQQLLAGLLFALTFALILSERIHRTIVAMVGAVAMVALGMALGFYDQEEALRSIDFNTLGLLLGMMILVAMLERTGFFEYLATVTAQRSGGEPWKLLVLLGTITTVASMFLDNVTTIVLIAPVTILIAEILGISPLPLLLAEALLSDTGGVATLIGDPPNILIGSASGLTFLDFIVHLAPLVAVAWLIALVLLYFIFRNDLYMRPQNIDALMKLDASQAIHDRGSLRKILIVLAGIILLFFVHGALGLLPSFVALGGAALALIWVRPDIDELLKEIKWGVLLFFAALFVAVGGLEASGLLGALARQLTGFAAQDTLLTSVLILWVSAITSAIIDNIPFTIVMIPVIQELGAAGVNIIPLWWALALGAGFGGNGTPIGSTANVVTVALSERTKTPITFLIWMRSGLPVMLVTCLVATILFVLLFDFMSSPAR